MSMGTKIFAGALLTMAVCRVDPVYAFRTGISSDVFGDGGCNECHSGGNAPAVEVIGPEFIRPGSTQAFTVRIGASGDQSRGGFNVSAPGGTLGLGGKNSKSARVAPGPGGIEITHSGPRAASKGVVSFSFLWTAPPEFSAIDLSVWGNAVNGNGSPSGDQAAHVIHTLRTGEFGFCPGTPVSCATAAKTALQIDDSTDDGKDRLTFSWSRGPEIAISDLGNPTLDTSYYLCLYQDDALIAEIDIPGATDCGSAPCWKLKGDAAAPSAILYKNKVGAPAGVRALTLTAGGRGDSKIAIKASGPDLPDPLLRLPVGGSSVTAELHNTSTAACFGDTYAGDAIRQDDGARFAAEGSNR